MMKNAFIDENKKLLEEAMDLLKEGLKSKEKASEEEISTPSGEGILKNLEEKINVVSKKIAVKTSLLKEISADIKTIKSNWELLNKAFEEVVKAKSDIKKYNEDKKEISSEVNEEKINELNKKIDEANAVKKENMDKYISNLGQTGKRNASKIRMNIQKLSPRIVLSQLVSNRKELKTAILTDEKNRIKELVNFAQNPHNMPAATKLVEDFEKEYSSNEITKLFEDGILPESNKENLAYNFMFLTKVCGFEKERLTPKTIKNEAEKKLSEIEILKTSIEKNIKLLSKLKSIKVDTPAEESKIKEAYTDKIDYTVEVEKMLKSPNGAKVEFLTKGLQLKRNTEAVKLQIALEKSKVLAETAKLLNKEIQLDKSENRKSLII